jgi:iron complex outermembrane receptor protein
MRSVKLNGHLAVLAAVIATPAFAQAPEAVTAAVATTAAATAGEAATDVGEVVVTARRRAEAVQDTPLAISVVTSDAIAKTGAFNVGRLTQIAPSIQFYSSNQRNSAVNIRGIGAPFGLTNDGIEQGVGLYIDDVYYSRAAASTFDFLDVARVEVLRGPQGTLYGKNTTAGAINITTNAPTFDFEATGEVTIGNYDFKQAKAAISGPITDKLAARLAISSTDRRGLIYDVTSRRYINELDNLGFRGQLLYQPSDKLDVTLAGDYSNQDPVGQAQIYVRTGATQRPLNRQFAALAAAQNYAPPSTDPFDRITDVDASLRGGNTLGGASARIRWKVGPGTLTSVSAWRFWDWRPENDRDFTGLSVVAKSQNPSQQDQFTQELRYAVTADRFDFVTGAFVYYQRIDTQGTEAQGINASRWTITPSNALSNNPAVLNGLTALNTQYLKNTSAAVFGQVSWKVTDALTVQPGVRLNYDKKSGYYERKVFDGQGLPVLFGQTDAARVQQLGVYAPQLVKPTFSDWNFSYDLTVSYKFARDLLGYATYAKTFKSGGINQNGVPVDASNNPILAAGTVRPESVRHLEAGLKTQFWERRATLNLAVFRTSIGDYQANVTNGQFGVLRGYLANAEKVRTQGVEVDLSVRPSERLSAYVNGAYNDAKYVKFVDAPCPPELSGGSAIAAGQTPSAPGTPGGVSPANCDISGQRLPGVSKLSFSAGAEANAPATLLGKQGEVYLGFDGTYRSSFSSNPSPSAYTWVKGYAVANVRLGFRTDSGIDVFAWVRNALDKDYFDFLVVGPGNTGLIAGQPGDPRTYGVTLRARY